MKKITLELTDNEYDYFIDMLADLNSYSYGEFEMLNTPENYDFLEKVINSIFKENDHSRKDYMAKLNKQFKRREPLSVWSWSIPAYFSHLIRDSANHCCHKTTGSIPDQVLTRLMLAESLADGVVEFINSPGTFPPWELLCNPLDAFRPGWNNWELLEDTSTTFKSNLNRPGPEKEEDEVLHQNEDSSLNSQLELTKIKEALAKPESRITSGEELSKFCADCSGTGWREAYPCQKPCRKCNSNDRT